MSSADATPVIVSLPSSNWLTAHLQDSPAEIQLTLIKVTDETTGDIESFTLTVPGLSEAQDLALTVGTTQDDATTIALNYVTADNRAHVKLFSLSEAPTPQATQLVTVDAPMEEDETPAHAKPLVAFHPELAEWIFVWREGANQLGIVRLEQDGTIIPNTLTHALAQEGRVLDQGFGVAPLRDPADSGAYALVTYAKDNTASVFVTGAISCGIQ